MCGITGSCWTNPQLATSHAQLKLMTDAIQHRGPDAEGHYLHQHTQAGIALGHRRLSIIDLAAGQQPLTNEDQSLWIVFNGEIYNFQELRTELISKGHKFTTHSDTEVIIHQYEESGVDCLQKFRGMFAFALWDANKQQLFIARDRLGKKPLIYRHDTGRLIFSSELKSLLTIPGIPRELNHQSIDDYLCYQYVPHPHSILKGFHKLPPAHFLIYKDDQLQIKQYWSPPYAEGNQSFADESLKDSNRWDLDTWKSKLKTTLTEAVKIRLRSDVPLGAFLSGGIDSTIIAGLMQQESSTPVHTFSIGFPVPKFDEREFAQLAATHLGTNHHEYLVEPKALEMLPDLVWHYDEPFADSSAIPTMYLSRMTRQEVTVALSGDGGDELFAGYDRYEAVALAQRFDRLPGFIKWGLSHPIWQNIPASVEQKSKRRRLKRFLQALGTEPRRRYLRWIGIFDQELRNEVYSPEMKQKISHHDAAEFLLQAYQLCPDRDFVTQTTAADVLTYLTCDILNKVDIASMSVGLECRSPLLDHHVAELAARMPLNLKRNQGSAKWILKETFKEFLPDKIINRPKMGFGVPLDHWFRNELQALLYDTLTSNKARSRGLFNPVVVDRLLDHHTKKLFDHSSRLWALLILELWQQKFLD